MLTFMQIAAILAVLQAFGVDTSVLKSVEADLTPTTVTVQAPVSTSTPETNIPSVQLFGSTNTPQVVLPTQSIVVHTSSTTPTVGTGMVQISATSYVNGIYTKMPINVTTNDPDLPSQFVINQPGQVNFFCVAPVYEDFPNHGCQNENPVTPGTFNFQFGTDQGVLASTTITVLQ